MKNTIDGLFDLRKEETIVNIGNGEGLKSTIFGTLRATVEQTDGSKIDVILKNVAYVPELTRNLFSITKAMENGFKVSSTSYRSSPLWKSESTIERFQST
jgi:hypothetical protein